MKRKPNVLPIVALTIVLAACSSAPNAQQVDVGTTTSSATPDSIPVRPDEVDAPQGIDIVEVGGVRLLATIGEAAFTLSNHVIALARDRRVDVIDGRTGQPIRSIETGTGMNSPILSSDGTKLLVSNAGELKANGMPPARSSVNIEIYDVTTGTSSSRFSITGNVVPETVSSDGNVVSLLSFVPPQAPDSYIVKNYYVPNGQLSVGISRDKDVNTEMQGVARRAVGDATNKLLHTLYSVPGPEGYAFVHALHVEQGWNFCIDLPPDAKFGSGQPALAITTDSKLYVAGSAGQLAEIDARPQSLKVTRTASIDGLGREAPVIAAGKSHVVVVGGKKGSIIDRGKLNPTATFELSGPASALAVTSDAVYVARSGAIDVIDPSTGALRATAKAPKGVMRLHVLPA